MKFSAENVKEIINHNQTILTIFQLPDNKSNHLFSFSIDGEMKEWRENNGELIQTVILKRPTSEILHQNKNEKSPKLKISKFHNFHEKMFCGYDDGRLFFRKKEELNKLENSNDDLSNDKLIENSICHKNIYILDLILFGHKQQILDLFYYPTKNYLISTSVDYTIKYWDLNDGSIAYSFNLDTIPLKILPYKDKKSEYFIFLCKENIKININTNLDQVSINSSAFPHCEINCFIEHNQLLFFASLSPNIIVLNSQSLTKVTEIVDFDVNEIYNLAIWTNYLISIGNDKMIKFWDMKKGYKKDFFLEASKDDTSCLFLKENFIFFGGYDRKVYKLNIKAESNTNYDRTRMMEEEKLSNAFNLALKSKVTKKRVKSGKGMKKAPASSKKVAAKGKKK